MKLLIAALALCLFTNTARSDDWSDLYETLLADIKGLVFVARATDSEWVSRYPRATVEARSDFAKSGIPVELLAQIYQRNTVQHIIEWKPRRKDLRFLPAAFASQASQDGLKRCLVPQEQSNVGIRKRQDDGTYGYFRAYYTFSLPALSSSGNEALVQVGPHCAPLSGSGERLIFLRKESGKWVEVSGLLFWIS
jgi:hypothetical protein